MFYRMLDDALAARSLGVAAGQEYRAHAVAACVRQIDVQLRRFLCEELVRHLHHHACTVSGLRIGSCGSAVS